MPCRLLFILLIALLQLPLPLHAASPAKARPLTGIGVLRIPAQAAGQPDITLYSEPGVGRLSPVAVTDLPLLQLSPLSGEYFYLPVVSRKRGWLKIICDDAERTAWTKSRTAWVYQRWDDFLPGLKVTVLKGLKKDYYQLRKASLPAAEVMENVERYPALEVLLVEGDWIFVAAGDSARGWLRWRDDNGRLLLQLPAEKGLGG